MFIHYKMSQYPKMLKSDLRVFSNDIYTANKKLFCTISQNRSSKLSEETVMGEIYTYVNFCEFKTL